MHEKTQAEHANVVTNKNKPENNTKMSLLQSYVKLRHISACAIAQIAGSLGWVLTGDRKINCASCAAGKAGLEKS